jgi:hypothetical protein
MTACSAFPATGARGATSGDTLQCRITYARSYCPAAGAQGSGICGTPWSVQALNAMSDGRHIVLSDRAVGLIRAYRERGVIVHPTPIGEYQKSGGGVKCLTLELRG